MIGKLALNDLTVTAQKLKFSIKEFFSKCDQICSFQQIWSHLLKKSLMENLVFCAVGVNSSFPVPTWKKKNKLKFFLSIFNSFHVVLLFSLKATQNRKYRKRLSDVAWINNKISLCRRSHRGDMKKVTWKYFSKHLYRSVFLIKFIKRC